MSISDLLSILALTISIFSVAVSARLYRQEIANQKYTDANEIFLMIDHVLIDHPEVRPYIYCGADHNALADDVLLQRVVSVAELMLDAGEWIIGKGRGLTKENESAQEDYLLSCLRESPAMMEHLTLHSEWHPLLAEIARREGLLYNAAKQGSVTGQKQEN